MALTNAQLAGALVLGLTGDRRRSTGISNHPHPQYLLETEMRTVLKKILPAEKVCRADRALQRSHWQVWRHHSVNTRSIQTPNWIARVTRNWLVSELSPPALLSPRATKIPRQNIEMGVGFSAHSLTEAGQRQGVAWLALVREYSQRFSGMFALQTADLHPQAQTTEYVRPPHGRWEPMSWYLERVAGLLVSRVTSLHR
jgi:hypothetical protein